MANWNLTRKLPNVTIFQQGTLGLAQGHLWSALGLQWFPLVRIGSAMLLIGLQWVCDGSRWVHKAFEVPTFLCHEHEIHTLGSCQTRAPNASLQCKPPMQAPNASPNIRPIRELVFLLNLYSTATQNHLRWILTLAWTPNATILRYLYQNVGI